MLFVECSYIQSFIRSEYYLLIDIAQIYEKLRISTYQFMDFFYMQVQINLKYCCAHGGKYRR